MSIVLIGYRGSGKSTIGRKLADRLWQPFVDTDELVVRKAGGKTIKEIFETGGEQQFRHLESEAVREVALLQEHVIALGGGALIREENRKLIKDVGLKVVYLRCEPQVLFQHIQDDPETAKTRPPLTSLGGGVEEIRKLLAEREPIYRQAMTAELDVTHLTPEEAVVYVVKLL
ncbi:MAG TPA: shikimate kinase [Tepidisphaeraceae bacterium]|nr:shikimate kinase [Tepidisphaeraceae bacterium]